MASLWEKFGAQQFLLFLQYKNAFRVSLLQSVISSAYLMGISLFPTDKDSEMVKVERSGLLMFHRPSKNRLKTHIWKKAMGAPETPRGQVGSDSSSDAHRKKSIKVCYISSKGWHKTVCHLLSRTQKLSVWRGDIMRCQLHFLEL